MAPGSRSPDLRRGPGRWPCRDRCRCSCGWAGLPFLDALDPGAEIQELLFDVLIPSLDVVSAANRGRPRGCERREDERSSGSQVRDLDLGPVQLRGPLED